jgi:putative chitinase
MTDWIAILARSARAAAAAQHEVAHPLASIINPMAVAMPEVCRTFEINTPRRQAHFVSQCAVESDYFQTLEEYASGAAYEGRKDLGNTVKGDGKRFKGRGPIQTTGRANYLQAQTRFEQLGHRVDLLAHPELLAQPALGLWAAGIWWEHNRANAVADTDPTGQHVSRLVNRGNASSKNAANGEARRLAAFKVALGILTAGLSPDA